MINDPQKDEMLEGLTKRIADMLRGPYKETEYGSVILPLIVLHRFDSALNKTRAKVQSEMKLAESLNVDDAMRDTMLRDVAEHLPFYNTYPQSLREIVENDEDYLPRNLGNYLEAFSPNLRDIFVNKFQLKTVFRKLAEKKVLLKVMKEFFSVDLSPENISNRDMGYIFEDLIRKYSENAPAGDHFTPREVIRLMVNLLLGGEESLLKNAPITSVYDPACGTGGMLSIATEYLKEHNPGATMQAFGQELLEESYGICASDMLIQGGDASGIRFGNTLTDDRLKVQRFEYMLANPPFGVDWAVEKPAIEKEYEALGFKGRFGAGLPRVSDGSLLFLQHMISKMRPTKDGGSRIGIIFSGSPLFTGGAGSGESEIRRWIIENDWLEAIIALPDHLFYNTGISTYIWIVTNRKAPGRAGKIQLIDGTSFFAKVRKALGEKTKEITEGQIGELTGIYRSFEDDEFSKVFDNADFGYRRVTVERPMRRVYKVTEDGIARVLESKAFLSLVKPKDTPAVQTVSHSIQNGILLALNSLLDKPSTYDRAAFTEAVEKALGSVSTIGKTPKATITSIVNAMAERDENAPPEVDAKGNIVPDPDLRDYENIPLKEDVQRYFEREVLPHVSDAFIDHQKTKVGYEIPFTKHFYKYTPPRPLEEIEADLLAIESEIQGLLAEVLN